MESKTTISEAARALGSTRSARKAASSRANLAKARAARRGAGIVQPVSPPQPANKPPQPVLIFAGRKQD